jgi:hypothetical protein
MPAAGCIPQEVLTNKLHPREAETLKVAQTIHFEMKPKKEKREARRIRHNSAWIIINGLAISECEVMDISQSGAKIVSDGTSAIPARFELAFVQGDQKRQTCEVVWRRGKMLGIKFVR